MYFVQQDTVRWKYVMQNALSKANTGALHKIKIFIPNG